MKITNSTDITLKQSLKAEKSNLDSTYLGNTYYEINIAMKRKQETMLATPNANKYRNGLVNESAFNITLFSKNGNIS